MQPPILFSFYHDRGIKFHICKNVKPKQQKEMIDMKKFILMTLLASILSCCLLLNGCADTNPATAYLPDETHVTENEETEVETETVTEQNVIHIPSLNTETATAGQDGPYGKISLSIPDGWRYETCPMDSGKLTNGLYGIRFYPEDATEGYIDLFYIDSFGVCGTGLVEETATIAGNPARIGTYDNHAYWDFISFQGDCSGIVALTCNAEDWWEAYEEQVMDILGTLSFDTSIKEGSAYIYSPQSEADEIGLLFELKKITPTGATLVFHQYDEKAPTGELEYGDAFVLEVLKNDQWEEVPATLSEYAFNAIAYTIPSRDSSERELDWEWIYGALEPGNYRMKKEIMDFRASGDFDKYTVYAQFILN